MFISSIPPLLTSEFTQDVLNKPADEFGNDEQVESLWAMKAFEHYEVYFNVSVQLSSGRISLHADSKPIVLHSSCAVPIPANSA